MAHIPTEKRIKEVQKITRKAIRRKKLSQLFKGKNFKSTGAGILPETEWKRHKS